jgi:nucleotide-binding universal stress UspA family protein
MVLTGSDVGCDPSVVPLRLDRTTNSVTSNAKELWKMNTTLNRILLAAYGSEGTEFAAHTAIRLANSAECELHLVYVERLPGYPAYAPLSAQHLEWELHEGAERAGLERLWQLDRNVRIAGGTVAGAHLRIGNVAEEVVGLAEELEVDLIVVGTRARSVIGRALMGSVSDSVLRQARCPVVVARSQDADGKRKGDPQPGSPPWGTGKARSAWSGIRWAMERGHRTY